MSMNAQTATKRAARSLSKSSQPQVWVKNTKRCVSWIGKPSQDPIVESPDFHVSIVTTRSEDVCVLRVPPEHTKLTLVIRRASASNEKPKTLKRYNVLHGVDIACMCLLHWGQCNVSLSIGPGTCRIGRGVLIFACRALGLVTMTAAEARRALSRCNGRRSGNNESNGIICPASRNIGILIANFSYRSTPVDSKYCATVVIAKHGDRRPLVGG